MSNIRSRLQEIVQAGEARRWDPATNPDLDDMRSEFLLARVLDVSKGEGTVDLSSGIWVDLRRGSDLYKAYMREVGPNGNGREILFAFDSEGNLAGFLPLHAEEYPSLAI